MKVFQQYNYQKRGCHEWIMQGILPVICNSEDKTILQKTEWSRSLPRHEKENIANDLGFLLFDQQGDRLCERIYGESKDVTDVLPGPKMSALAIRRAVKMSWWLTLGWVIAKNTNIDLKGVAWHKWFEFNQD